MQTKSFLFMSVVVVVAIAVVTSLIGVMVFQKPVLLADPQGTIQVQGLSTDIRNVFIVDPAFESKGISDNVTFTTVSPGNIHYTVVDGQTLSIDPRCDSTQGGIPGNCPAPFLIVNDGNSRADVVIQRNQLLFNSATEGATPPTSDLRIWIEEPDPDASGGGISPYRTGWDNTKIDDCDVLIEPSKSCFTSTPCTQNLGTPTSMCNILIGSDRNLINNLNWENDRDEAIMHVWIKVANNEPSGAKSTTVTVTGVIDTTIP